jgi:hypothetical protein
MHKKVNKIWYTITNTHTTDKDVAHMPTIEVRSLDLRTPTVTAEPFPEGSDPFVVNELNYLWIYVKDATTQVEVALRFQVVDSRLVLRSEPETVRQTGADLRSISSLADADIEWRAIMVHSPMRGIAHMEVSLVSVDDNLEVDALDVSGETLVVARVILGLITKIELVAS